MSAALDAGLRAALEGFAAGREALAAGFSATPLAGGISNRSWRVGSAAGDWVLRLAGSSDARLAVNRVAERQAQAAAAALGFAPAVVHAAPAQGVLVSEFLPGSALTRAELESSATLSALGARLAELHSHPPPRGVRRLDLHAVLAHYLELAPLAAGPVSRPLLGARLRWAVASYAPVASALCHNDLHHRNILAAERLMFVDWEYAGVGDPLFELAAVIGYHDLDANQRATLLAAHGGPFTSAQLASMSLTFDCLHALWLDAANGWQALAEDRRQALLARLAIDPAERQR